MEEEKELKPNYGLLKDALNGCLGIIGQLNGEEAEKPTEAEIKAESMKQLDEFKQRLITQKRL